MQRLIWLTKTKDTISTDHTPGRLAWPLAIAAIVGVSVAFVFGIFSAIASGETGFILSHQGLTPFVTISFAIVGALVITRHPKNPIGWIFLATGWLYALTLISGIYYRYVPALSDTGVLPGANLAEWLNNWIWIPAIILPTIFVFFFFPDGRVPTPRWRVLAWSAGLGMTVTILALMLHPGPVEAWDTGVNPYGIPAITEALDLFMQIGQLLLLVGLVGSIAAFAVRFRRSRDLEREQMKWLAYAIGLMILGMIVVIILPFTLPDQTLAANLSIAITNLSILGIAVAASIAILRYRLYNINLVVNRTLLYAALTVSVIVIYVLLVGGLSALFQAQGNLIIVLLATGLVALIFQSLRERLQRGVNRLMYGQRDEPFNVLARLGEKLEGALSPEVIYPTIVETVSQTLKLPYAAIAVKRGGAFETVESYGKPDQDPIIFPLTYQGEIIGRLLVSRRAPNEALSPADERLLRNIARQAGAAVHAAQLTVDLQRSRQQLVANREEERRRLRRDLHDGLGSTLAALNLQAGALKRTIKQDPDEAEIMVEELRTDVRSAIDDIRRLVYELRPPVLDELGLAAAVRAQAARYQKPDGDDGSRRAGLQISVEAPEALPHLPAAVEVAAYRIVQEALANVAHHAQARHCLIRLALDDSLRIEVADDGIGLPPSKNGGLGLLSMRERALELGGDCRIVSKAGSGTRVRASLPLFEENITNEKI
jgi:signal transduction histidine kinase